MSPLVIDLGNIIMAGVMLLGAFSTAIGFAYSAKSDSKGAHTRIDLLQEEVIPELKSQIADLKARHDALDSKIVEKLSEIEKALARIQGRLSITNKSDLA